MGGARKGDRRGKQCGWGARKDGIGPNVEHYKVPVQRPYPGLRERPGPPPPAPHRAAFWYSTRIHKLLQRALG